MPLWIASQWRAVCSLWMSKRRGFLSLNLGKPEAYVMTALEPETAMTFAGTTDPVCYVEVKSVGQMSAAQTEAMSQDFCQQISNALSVPSDRIYIEFADAKGYLWGWNGRTL